MARLHLAGSDLEPRYRPIRSKYVILCELMHIYHIHICTQKIQNMTVNTVVEETPARAYGTIRCEIAVTHTPAPPFQSCLLKPCAPVQDFSHSTPLLWSQIFPTVPMFSREHEGQDSKCFF